MKKEKEKLTRHWVKLCIFVSDQLNLNRKVIGVARP